MKDLSLYFHIPFCKLKCNYCDFNSYGNKEDIQEEYILCLIKEFKKRLELINKYNINTVFIGGGTPTYLNSYCLEMLLSSIKKNISTQIEFTCEANPGTLDIEKLNILKRYGVNRLSIGLQSFDDDILKFLGRIHTSYEFTKNYFAAREVGFNNINIDLIFSIPGQSNESFINTIKEVVELKPEHISCYSLIIEEGTKFYNMVKNNTIKEVDDNTDREMYYSAVDLFGKYNYKQYEISNFAKTGFECMHNITYWSCREYIGIGAGAHSYIDNLRFSNEKIPEKYMSEIKLDKLPIATEEILSLDDKISEFMFMGLRMIKGIDIKEFKYRFNIDVTELYKKQIKKLIEQKLIIVDDKRIYLTKKGIDLSNIVFLEFLL